MMSAFPSLVPSRDTSLVVLSVATTLITSALVRRALDPPAERIIPSPRETLLPKLTKEEQGELPYPPGAFPGARDVESPYGTIRVYEWGPETGRKVLLIHGISTPCVSLGGLSNILTDQKRCRVILLDLFGRGYSDSPDLPHDARLYTTQILLAITSSPLPWTPDGFSIIGYSLGGGIAADFAAYFSHLVKGLALLAPAGLIRDDHFGWHTKLVYAGFVPRLLLERTVKKKLTDTKDPEIPPPSSSPSSSQEKDDGVGKRCLSVGDKVAGAVSKESENAAANEMRGISNPHFNSTPLSKGKAGLTVASAVRWQLEFNRGFVRSFVSSIRWASISGHAKTWGKLRDLRDGVKVVILVGRTDPVIVATELEEDAKAAIGQEKVEWRVMEGGHEFPITQPDAVVEEIDGVWKF
ncbi:alpha/beta-hydrolase [Amylocarpus encephaloides]|uniref:Alpha/beta-hydrolase n=1 Tax=Amylocarpus encephaloides TaxID=45428 RepID=A0A9P7YQ09_9HELO|nr:alpha/beta-hydrolase [Amylocarpus encephaloides]